MNSIYHSPIILGTGFVLGIEHALDADHVAAISTIVSRTKSLRKSSLFGLFWGAGHTITLFLFGILVLLFKLSIPKKLALSFEFIVGIMLIMIGADLIMSLSKKSHHTHEHKHNGISHLHEHSDLDIVHSHHKKSFVIGMIHGLAGSAALMLLVLSTVKSIPLGIFFILIFGIGSIFGMFITSALISLPLILVERFKKFRTILSVISGLASIFIGFAILYEIVFVRRLFSL